MNKLKLFVYENALPHIHDSDPAFENLVPMSKRGIDTYFELVNNPHDADFFYMGQFSDGTKDELIRKENFQYYDEYTSRHICDIEGDWPGRTLPLWLKGSIITINGLRQTDKGIPLAYFVRPTFSKLFIHLAKERLDSYPDFPEENLFGFRGFMNSNARQKALHALELSRVPQSFEMIPTWNGHTLPTTKIATDYEETMKSYTFALCPRGNGQDSVRFFEACFFGRIPVVIADNVLFDEDSYDTSFVVRISAQTSVAKMAEKFDALSRMSRPEVYMRGRKAREYFDSRVRSYMNDPTGYFINKLNLREK